MDRSWLLTRLDAYRPQDAADAARRDRLAAFVRSHENCADRTLSAGHVVASAWVVSADRTQVLLHHHRKLDRWLQFGGHIDGDKTPLEAARRELAEESGLAPHQATLLSEAIFDLDIHPIPANPKEAAHLHLDVRFCFSADPETPLARSHESHALRWFPVSGLAAVSDEPSVLRMAEKAVRIG
ncbi:MAG: NUDIX hydrolase [Nitrospirota bacterium]|nr:NUDIX hydrolase [Nitrospirota bacterium]